ncbi:hypothetical protein MJA45_06305 [Paenibacillus aurantius]|uniref:Uncharacterized protein n=1 Tax=Paenibacillus aurantius TaxID=2918900 RepID=A0AA96REN2_9BACL|nr:hypothetical protein [Paenibacillus aurantius]WNQ12640.1 hypothetical protein MJA45_06305 [Paenibacillus aurantius]
MSYACPVCNGFESVDALCPSCSASALDQGKIHDFFGPYSPYRPTDEMALTNGFRDAAWHQCVHVFWCPSCGETFNRMIEEWRVSR